jgi:conjugal transfer/entry exclusion protein
LIDGANNYTVGQLRGQLKKLGELEEAEEGLYKIVKIKDYLSAGHSVSSAPPPAVSVTTTPDRTSISTSVSADVDALVAGMSRHYLDAKGLAREVAEEIEKTNQQISELNTKFVSLKAQEDVLANILKPGGAPENAARKTGVLDKIP